MKNSIEFLEKPVTADEVQVASLLERIVKAIVAKDLKMLISVYSDTASIEMSTLRDALLNKSEYEARMSKIIGNIRNIYFNNTIIRVTGQEAVISCISNILLHGMAFSKKNQRYFKCVKEDGKWRIIEARYI